MKDIALKAGVSVTTVSHVISKTRNVAQETRELVLRTLEELDYQQPDNRPDEAAPLDRIGVITADIQEDYYILLVKTIETIASENNISVLFCDSEDDEEKEARGLAVHRGEVHAEIGDERRFRTRGDIGRGHDGVGVFECSSDATCGGDVVFFDQNAVV